MQKHGNRRPFRVVHSTPHHRLTSRRIRRRVNSAGSIGFYDKVNRHQRLVYLTPFLYGDLHAANRRRRTMYVQPLESAAPFTVAGIEFRMVLPRDLTGSSEVVWERLEPGRSTPTDAHASFAQIFLILRGSGEVTIGNECSPVAPHDTVFVPTATFCALHQRCGIGLPLYQRLAQRYSPSRDRLASRLRPNTRPPHRRGRVRAALRLLSCQVCLYSLEEFVS